MVNSMPSPIATSSSPWFLIPFLMRPSTRMSSGPNSSSLSPCSVDIQPHIPLPMSSFVVRQRFSFAFVCSFSTILCVCVCVLFGSVFQTPFDSITFCFRKKSRDFGVFCQVLAKELFGIEVL